MKKEHPLVNHPILWRIAPLMRPDVVTMFVVDIDFFFTCTNFNFLLKILAEHAIMDLIEGEGEVLW